MTHKEFTKKTIAIFGLSLLLVICMIGNAALFPRSKADTKQLKTAASGADSAFSAITTGVQAVWISFGDYKAAGLYQKSEAVFKANARTYFKKLKNDGINTIYFHVVPCNDAIYPSSYLKWSKYMFKKAPGYDPLDILVDAAHDNGIYFHAWLNPYRKRMGVSFNPGKQSSLNRIVRIVKEIIQNYDVDGIHFDDYFYPSHGRGAQFNGVSNSRRKAVINKMVKKIYQTVKNEDEDLLFGISPAGNVEYAESLGCDLTAWMSHSNYIDYIVPQIYWSDSYRSNGKMTKLFSDRLAQWTELNEDGIPMYIGLALYRAGSSSSTDRGWKNSSYNLVTQIKKTKNAGCDGFVLFSSAYMYQSRTKKEMAHYRTYVKSHKNW